MDVPPSGIQQAFELALQHHRSGQLTAAEMQCRQVVRQQPNHADAMNLLGIVSFQLGRLDEGIDLIRRAISLDPHRAAYHTNLGNALAVLGHTDDAIASFRQALGIQPDLADAWNNLGNALQVRGEVQEAIAAHRRAIELRPDFAQAYYNLAGAYKRGGDLDASIAAYDEALRRSPNYAEAEVNRANLLKESGRLDEAIAGYRRALDAKPSPVTASNLVFALSSHPDYTSRDIYGELVRWNEKYARPLAATILPHDNDRSASRRLRIGYVSPDFSEHPAGRFVLPLLANHDHAHFEVFCYSDVRKPEPMTHRLKSCADVWRDTAGFSDVQLAGQIRQDKIDILIDLSMHMAAHRLLVFARKPAPVQVTWLGYPGSSGLDTIDYRLSDPYLDPLSAASASSPQAGSGQAPGLNDAFYSEKTVRLPDCYWCYDPLVAPIPVNDLPARSSGVVTFGCLNNFAKVTPPTIELWARVLCAVPSSRLLVLVPGGSARQRLLDRLQQHGVAPERVEFTDRLSRPRYMDLYHRIDLSLDTFPYNGHTTSFDSLWMGVPVVSLFGQTAVSRGGLSILSNLGLAELVTDDPNRYLQLAADLARDLDRLATLRATLRQRLEQSPLMDGKRFARNIEAAYRQIWLNWCSNKAPAEG